MDAGEMKEANRVVEGARRSSGYLGGSAHVTIPNMAFDFAFLLHTT